MSNYYNDHLGTSFTVGSTTWHSFRDFGVYPHEKPDIPTAEAKTHFVPIPCADGGVDMTEYLGAVTFNNREGTFTYAIVGDRKMYNAKLTRIAACLHGKVAKIILDEEPEFFYRGRVAVEGLEAENFAPGIITVTADLEPYKYAVRGPTEAWLWDPFNFETGVIRETGAINVQGSATIPVISSPYGGIPTITSTAAITMVCGGVTYNLTAGTNVLEELVLPRDESIVYMAFTGSGVVSVDYVVGYL